MPNMSTEEEDDDYISHLLLFHSNFLLLLVSLERLASVWWTCFLNTVLVSCIVLITVLVVFLHVIKMTELIFSRHLQTCLLGEVNCYAKAGFTMLRSDRPDRLGRKIHLSGCVGVKWALLLMCTQRSVSAVCMWDHCVITLASGVFSFMSLGFKSLCLTRRVALIDETAYLHLLCGPPGRSSPAPTWEGQVETYSLDFSGSDLA